MRYGSPWGSGWGSPDNMVAYAYFRKRNDNSGGILIFKPRANYGNDYFAVGLNARPIENVYAKEGLETKIFCPLPWGARTFAVMPVRIGALSDPKYLISKVLRVYEALQNKRVTLKITFKPKVIEPLLNDNAYTSAWTITGLRKNAHTLPVAGHPQWGRMTLTISVSGGVVTLTLKVGTYAVASGSATILGAPFTVNLTASNSSGVTASCTVAAAVASTDATIDVRWPYSMRVLRDTTDPPTTLRATVLFRGDNVIRWTEPEDLASGTYYYRDQPVSDTGDVGTASSSVSKVITAPPTAPTSLAYSSGNAAAMVLSFLNSATAGATYRAYLPIVIGNQMSLNDIQATKAAGTPSASNTITLPAITGYPGTIPVLVRAVSGGVEERNGNILFLEFDSSGVFIPARPNTPGLQRDSIAITSGLSLAARATYDPTNEKGVATTIQLFKRTPSGSYNYNSADASGTLASSVGTLKAANLSYVFASAGYYYVRVLAATAGGVQSPSADAPELLVFVSAEDMPADTALEAVLGRS